MRIGCQLAIQFFEAAHEFGAGADDIGLLNAAQYFVDRFALAADVDIEQRHAAADYRSAVHMIRPTSPNWQVPVLTCSAITGDGIAEVWRKIESYRETMTASCEFNARRAEQAKAWMWSEIEESLIATLRKNPEVEIRVNALESEVAHGERAPGAAARELLSIFLGAKVFESP